MATKKMEAKNGGKVSRRLWAWAAALMIIAASLPAAHCQDILWQPLFDEGKKALQRGDMAQAERQLDAALSQAGKFSRGDSRLTATLLCLAKVEFALGKFAPAQDYYSRAIAALRKQPDESLLLALALGDQADVLQAMGAMDQVEKILLEGLALREHNGGESDKETIASLERLADFYLMQSRFAEAQPLYKKAIKLRQSKGVADDPLIIKDLEQLGLLFQKQGRSSDAAIYFKQAVVMSERLLGPDDLAVADALMALGKFFVDDDQAAQAVPLLQRALAIRSKKLPDSDAKIARTLEVLGNAYMAIDDYVACENALRRALSIDETLRGKDEILAAHDLSALGQLYLSQGKYDEAEHSYVEALDKTSKLRGEQHYDTATCMNNLAFLYRNNGNYPKALALLQQALAIREKVFGCEHPFVAQNLINMADVLSVTGKYSDAETALKRALQIDEKVLGADHDYVAMMLRDLIEVLQVENKTTEAVQVARQILQRDEHTANGDSLVVAADLDLLAKLLIAEGNVDEAKSLKGRSHEIRSKIASHLPDLDSQLNIPPSNLRPVKHKWALVIGISSFKDPSINLKYAAKDATDFRNFLINQEHFQADHVRLLTDKDASRASVVSLLGDGWLKRVVGADDLVVIYISSHGSQSRNDIGGANFIVPYEGNLENIVLTGIPMQWLTVGLKDMVPCDRLCVFLDVCHGGAAGGKAQGDRPDGVNDAPAQSKETGFKDLRPPSGDAAPGCKGMARTIDVAKPDTKGLTRVDATGSPVPKGGEGGPKALGSGEVVMAASQADQVSWESKRYANGVFTRRLMEGLRCKAEDTTLTDAFDYLKDRVEEEVLRDRGELQSPVIVPRAPKNFQPRLALPCD